MLISLIFACTSNAPEQTPITQEERETKIQTERARHPEEDSKEEASNDKKTAKTNVAAPEETISKTEVPAIQNTAPKQKTQTKTARKTQTKTITKTVTEPPERETAEEIPTPSTEEKSDTNQTQNEKATVSPVSFSVNDQNSALYVRVFKDPNTLGAAISHNHVMLSKKWSGSVRWNTQDPSSCQIEIELPVKELVVDPSHMRKRLKMKGEISKGQRKDIRKNMLAKGQLYAQKYPNITFRSEACERKGESLYLEGVLQIRGKDKKIRTRMTEASSPLQLNGSFSIRATDFGFSPYSGLMGAVKNRDDMKIYWRLTSN